MRELLRLNNIPTRRVVIGGYADNDTPENRARNRRVEIIIGDEKFNADGQTVAVRAEEEPAALPKEEPAAPLVEWPNRKGML